MTHRALRVHNFLRAVVRQRASSFPRTPLATADRTSLVTFGHFTAAPERLAAGRCARMGPWARQAEFESGLARLRKSKSNAAREEELTQLALAEPRAAYKGVIGAITHGIKKAKPRHRCARRGASQRSFALCSRGVCGPGWRCCLCSALWCARRTRSSARRTYTVRRRRLRLR